MKYCMKNSEIMYGFYKVIFLNFSDNLGQNAMRHHYKTPFPPSQC